MSGLPIPQIPKKGFYVITTSLIAQIEGRGRVRYRPITSWGEIDITGKTPEECFDYIFEELICKVRGKQPPWIVVDCYSLTENKPF